MKDERPNGLYKALEVTQKPVLCGTNNSLLYACQGSSDPGVVHTNRGSGDPLQASLTGAGFLPRCTSPHAKLEWCTILTHLWSNQ